MKNKKKEHSFRIDCKQENILEELISFMENKTSRNEICCAAISMLYDCTDEMDTKKIVTNKAIDMVGNVCSDELFEFFKLSLMSGSLISDLKIEYINNFIEIPKGTKIIFAPPFSIEFKLSTNVLISLDLSPQLNYKLVNSFDRPLSLEKPDFSGTKLIVNVGDRNADSHI